jgi:hypothetical protein
MIQTLAYRKGVPSLKNASPTLEEGVLMEKAFCFGGVVSDKGGLVGGTRA